MLDTESRYVLDQGPSSRDPWLTTMDWNLGTDQSLQEMLDCDIKDEIDSVIGGHPELGFNFTDLSPLELDDDPVVSCNDLNGWFGSQSLLNGNSNSSNSENLFPPSASHDSQFTNSSQHTAETTAAAPPEEPAPCEPCSPEPFVSSVKMVELSRREYRVSVYYDFKRGLSPEDSYKAQQQIWGVENAPERFTIDSLYREFKTCGWTNEPRPIDVATLQRLLRNDPDLSCSEIERRLSLSRSSVESLLKETLGLRRRRRQWVPKKLSESQLHARLDWCHFMLKKFNRGMSSKVDKILSSTDAWLYEHREADYSYWSFDNEMGSGQRRLVLCFFSTSGHVATACLIDRRSLTSEAYIKDCLSRVISNWRALQPNGRLYLHHDDAPVHVTARTLNYLNSKDISSLPHPPCSPDLDFDDRQLSPSVTLRGQKYDNEEEAAMAYAMFMGNIIDWSDLFKRWFNRMRTCVAACGNYVEEDNFNLDLSGCDAASIMVNPNSVMPHMSVRSPTPNNNASSTISVATATAASTTTNHGTVKRHFAFPPKIESKENSSRSELLTTVEQGMLLEQNGTVSLDEGDVENEAESDAEHDYDNDATASSEEEDVSEDEEQISQPSSISSPGTLKLSLHPNKSKAFLLPASTIKTLSPQLLKAHQQQALKVNGITGIRLQNLKILQSPGQVQQIRRQIYNNSMQLVTTQQQTAVQQQQLLQQQQTQSHITQLAASTTSSNCPKRDKELNPLGHDYDEKPYPKPAYSYSCLIAMALKNSQTGSLPVSEIYSFMCEHFPYFKTAPNGWKNSVRHNLSLNKCFEKIEKPAGNGSQRKGCLWAINPAKITKMDEEVQKWSRKDPLAIKKAMIYPEQLELLERGEMKYVGSGSGDLSEETESSAGEAEGPEEAAQPHHTGLGGLSGSAAGHLAANSVTDSYDESSQDDCDVDVSEQLYNEIDIDEENKDDLHMQLNISSAKEDSGLDYQLSPSAKRQKTLTGTLQANYVYQPVTTARRKTSSLFVTTGTAAGSFLKIE